MNSSPMLKLSFNKNILMSTVNKRDDAIKLTFNKRILLKRRKAPIARKYTGDVNQFLKIASVSNAKNSALGKRNNTVDSKSNTTTSLTPKRVRFDDLNVRLTSDNIYQEKKVSYSESSSKSSNSSTSCDSIDSNSSVVKQDSVKYSKIITDVYLSEHETFETLEMLTFYTRQCQTFSCEEDDSIDIDWNKLLESSLFSASRC